MHESIFVVNTPIQYLMARLIIQTQFSTKSTAILFYNDRHDYGEAFAIIDQRLGPLTFEELELNDEASALRTDRLFICDRYNPTQVLLSYQLKHRLLCAFEDGLAFYLGAHPYVRNWNDQNQYRRLKELIKLGLSLAGIKTAYRPSAFPFKRFDEVYSVFPLAQHSKPFVQFSIESALRSLSCGIEPHSRPTALVLSQALVTDRATSADVYIRYLRDRIAELRERGNTVYFKSHPRDPAELGAELVATGAVKLLPAEYRTGPVEFYLADHPGTAVYGFTSSTLAYAGLLKAEAWSFGIDFCVKTSTQPEFETLLRNAKPALERAGVQWYESK